MTVQFEPESWLEAVWDIGVGTIVGSTHFLYITGKWWYVQLVAPAARLLLGWDLPVEKVMQSRDGEKTLKVIVVGYGRTGTYSAGLALEEMGFPILHTKHFYHHESLLRMWTNEVFLPSIEANEPMMGRPDFSMITSLGYQGTADLPMALYFEQVLEEYPDCKFVLTTRENSEVWFNSWKTLTETITQPTYMGGLFFTMVEQYTQYYRWLYSIINKDKKFLSVPFPLPEQNKEAAIASYEEHNRRVREVIPPAQLLEYNVKEGWEPLCRFMEMGDDCPTVPFPKTNSTRQVQVQTVSAQVVTSIGLSLGFFFTITFVVQKITGKSIAQWARFSRRHGGKTMRRMVKKSD